MKSGALFEPSRFMEATENRITDAQTKQSLREQPWDGFCGLLKVCDDINIGALLASQEQEQGTAPPPTEEASLDGTMLQELEATLRALQHRPPTERLPLLLQVADRAFALGTKALQAGKRGQAVQLLQLAEAACPETKINARRKIQTALQACNNAT